MNVVCDLDGVVYRGERLVDGSDTALRDLVDHDVHLVFVTNNSTRTPGDVVGKLERVVGIRFKEESVVTSAQAAASMLGSQDDPAFVFGSSAISEAIALAGRATTRAAPEARSVVVGLDRDLSYDRLSEAADAIRSGARFVATNTDPTFPTATGLKPGSGAVVAALETSTGVKPEVAGKPHQPMRDLIRARGVEEAWVIGDRMDTDVALAAEEPSWHSILVLTGVTETAGPGPDHVCTDLRAAVDLLLAGPSRQ